MRLETRLMKSWDGIELFVRNYFPDEFDSGKTLFWIHGLGEHGGRQEHVARFLTDRGWRMVIADLRGHGHSTGIATHVHSFSDYVNDTAEVWSQLGLSNESTALLGHSMGGLVAVRAVQTHSLSPAALVLSSPLLGLKLHVNPLAVALGKIFVRWISTLRFSNGIDPSNMTHDSEFAALRRNDRLINKTVTAGWFFAMKSALAAAHRDVRQVTLPTLTLQGTLDRTTDPDALAAWFQQIPSLDKNQLDLDGHYHELFFEPDWKTTIHQTVDWLDSKVTDR